MVQAFVKPSSLGGSKWLPKFADLFEKIFPATVACKFASLTPALAEAVIACNYSSYSCNLPPRTTSSGVVKGDEDGQEHDHA